MASFFAKNKKIQTVILASFFLFFFSLSPAFADQGNLSPCAEGSTDIIGCQVQNLQIGGVVGQVIQFIFVIAVLLSLGFLVYGGIKWITSGGDKSNVEAARGTIIAAIIGLIIVFLAYVILNLVITFLTGDDFGSLTIPSISELENGPSLPDCYTPGGNPAVIDPDPGVNCQN